MHIALDVPVKLRLFPERKSERKFRWKVE